MLHYLGSGFITNGGTYDLKVKETPMFNVMADYGLGKKVTVGVAFGYQKATVDWDFGSFSTGYIDTWTRIHLAVRGDYDIIAKDNMVMYTGAKIGYNIYSLSSTASAWDPNYQTDLNVHLNPISVQAHFGFSYFFAKIVGLNAEVGIGYGGPYLFAIGATVKI